MVPFSHCPCWVCHRGHANPPRLSTRVRGSCLWAFPAPSLSCFCPRLFASAGPGDTSDCRPRELTRRRTFLVPVLVCVPSSCSHGVWLDAAHPAVSGRRTRLPGGSSVAPLRAGVPPASRVPQLLTCCSRPGRAPEAAQQVRQHPRPQGQPPGEHVGTPVCVTSGSGSCPPVWAHRAWTSPAHCPTPQAQPCSFRGSSPPGVPPPPLAA